MPIQLGKRTATLSGAIRIEEVEPLAAWLGEARRPTVNLRRCTLMHTAVLQALLAARAVVSVPPADGFLRLWILPMFDGVQPNKDPPAHATQHSTDRTPR
jgi:hypothetical protein